MTDTDASQWRAGKTNLITDVAGVKVGNAQNRKIKTGVTVLTADQPFVASVDVMGGAPGTRETDCLAPDRLVQTVDALVLSGGSAFGLDAASGVVQALRAQGRGYAVGPVTVPIVPAAIIFDCLNGGATQWHRNPYANLGRKAFESATASFKLGSIGAGFGATTANLKGGLGSASLQLPSGAIVGALVVANPHGSVVVPGTGHFWAAPFEIDAEFGGLGMPASYDSKSLPRNEKFKAFQTMCEAGLADDSPTVGVNTTIAIVATNLKLDKAQLKRMAVAAQDGMARSIVPSHTPFDGDLVFALSTGEQNMQDEIADSMQAGHAAAVCLSRAIARSVFFAESYSGDTLPSWRDLYATLLEQ